MFAEKPLLWWLLETHVAFHRLGLFFADWLVPEGGTHNVAVGEVLREFLPVGGGAQVRPAFLLQVERNLGGQADDPLIVYRHMCLRSHGMRLARFGGILDGTLISICHCEGS